ncbi:MAG TPA: hypothetical protein VK763_20750 [Terriglobales bacterium]|nr:hypothetical protein [Terriglobales bacterium]
MPRARLILPVLVVLVPLAHTQVFQVAGGSSSLFEANGGSMQIHGEGWESGIGLGSFDKKTIYGGFIRRRWKRVILTVGDAPIPIHLPTDLFDNSHYFLARGASISLAVGRLKIFGFGGTTSTGLSVPFFAGGSYEQGAGALFLDYEAFHTLTLFTRTILSSSQTAISGVDWHPFSHIRASSGGGIGANHKFLSASVSADAGLASLKFAYTAAATNFQRIVVSTPTSTENVGPNVLLALHPVHSLEFTAAHMDFQQSPIGGYSSPRATLNEVSTTYGTHGFSLSGALFRSKTSNLSTTGTSASITRRVTDRLQAGLYLYRSRPDHMASLTSELGMLREVISSRLSLVELVNHVNGGTTLSWGGEFISNPVSFSVNYETVYSPFTPLNPFRQVVLLNVSLQPFSLFQINAGTYVGPDGTVKYTTYGQAQAYRGSSAPDSARSFKFPRYVVSGHVLDKDGLPLRGVALSIRNQLVFTDRDGYFFALVKKSKPVPLTMHLEDSILPGRFMISSCPASVMPATADTPLDVLVVLEKVAPSR